jgi:hypothetical protein
LTRTDDNHGDPVAEAAPAPMNWDRHFVYFKDGGDIINDRGRFVDGLKFELSGAEAVYLRNCYLGVDKATPPPNDVHRSLLAHLISNRRKAPFAYPWDVKPPNHLADAVEHARRLSTFARGAMLQYYYWVIQGRRAEDLEVPSTDLAASFSGWWKEGRPMLLQWNTDDFLVRRQHNLRTSRSDTVFIKEWLRHCRDAKSYESFLVDEAVRRLIVNRERICKPRKARLTYPKDLRAWDRKLPKFDDAFQLDFRASIGNVFVQRIVTGLDDRA